MKYQLWLVGLSSIICAVLADVENMPEFDAEEDEIDCPNWESKRLISPYVPWNTMNRAFLTMPPEVEMRISVIPDAGLGIFATSFIPRYTWLAEYEGEHIQKLSQISDYAWKVKRNGRAYFYVDAYDEATSNWIRWINCSRHKREENVEVFECRGKMYYVSNRDIYPGQELLVYYGDGYAEGLDIDTENYRNMDIFLNDETNTCQYLNETKIN